MKKVIRKLAYILAIFIMASSITTIYAAEVDDNEGDKDINIRIQALKDRQYGSQALTDGYEIEILTPQSSYYETMVSQYKQKELKHLANSLNMDGFERKDKSERIYFEAVNYELFSNDYVAKNTSGIQADTKIRGLIIIGSISCMAVGFILAKLWHKFRKKKV